MSDFPALEEYREYEPIRVCDLWTQRRYYVALSEDVKRERIAHGCEVKKEKRKAVRS